TETSAYFSCRQPHLRYGGSTAMTRSLDVERKTRRANSRQIGGKNASQLTGGRRPISPYFAGSASGPSQREIRRRPRPEPVPPPIKLGEGKNGRIAYVESEVLEWVAARISERDRHVATGEPKAEPELDYPETEPQRGQATARPRQSRGAE